MERNKPVYLLSWLTTEAHSDFVFIFHFPIFVFHVLIFTSPFSFSVEISVFIFYFSVFVFNVLIFTSPFSFSVSTFIICKRVLFFLLFHFCFLLFYFYRSISFYFSVFVFAFKLYNENQYKH